MNGPTRLRRRFRAAAMGLVATATIGAISTARGATADLSFTPQMTTASIDDIIEIEMYVSSDRAPSPELSFVDALLIWDPTTLELLQADPASCFNATFLLCGFSPNPDGLNDGTGSPNLPNNDGNALHTSLTNVEPPVFIPAGPGLLVTTFRFRAIAETEATSVFLMDNWPGGFSRTRVFAPGNVELTGDISGAMTVVTICGAAPDADGDGVADNCDVCPGSDDNVDSDEDGIPDGCDPCPLIETPGVMQGDLDDNGAVQLADVPIFVQVLLGLDLDPTHVATSDVNCDGDVNGLDVFPLVQLLI